MWTVFDEMWYIVEYFIVDIFFFFIVFLLVKIQNENNIYPSCVKSTQPYVYTNFLHQLHMHANTTLCVIINMLYLNLLDDQ